MNYFLRMSEHKNVVNNFKKIQAISFPSFDYAEIFLAKYCQAKISYYARKLSELELLTFSSSEAKTRDKGCGKFFSRKIHGKSGNIRISGNIVTTKIWVVQRHTRQRKSEKKDTYASKNVAPMKQS